MRRRTLFSWLIAVALAAIAGIAFSLTSFAVTPPTTSVCTTSALRGTCGPYVYPQITGATSNTSVDNNVWSPITGTKQSLSVTNPGKWQVTANIPAGNTSVVSYPSVGGNYGQTNDTSTPLSAYASIYSAFSENMNATSKTSAWAAYDIWLGSGTSSAWSGEVMIQHNYANNGACTFEATASFGGSGGVPVQTWNLCQFGSELVWKLPSNETGRQRGHLAHAPMAGDPRLPAEEQRPVGDRVRLGDLQHRRDERNLPAQRLLDHYHPVSDRMNRRAPRLAAHAGICVGGRPQGGPLRRCTAR